jgi:hypothetical protein
MNTIAGTSKPQDMALSQEVGEAQKLISQVMEGLGSGVLFIPKNLTSPQQITFVSTPVTPATPSKTVVAYQEDDDEYEDYYHESDEE